METSQVSEPRNVSASSSSTKELEVIGRLYKLEQTISRFISTKYDYVYQSILRHESVLCGTFHGRRRIRTAQTQNGFARFKFSVCAEIGPSGEYAPHVRARVSFSFPNIGVSRTVPPTFSRRPLLAHFLGLLIGP